MAAYLSKSLVVYSTLHILKIEIERKKLLEYRKDKHIRILISMSLCIGKFKRVLAHYRVKLAYRVIYTIDNQ